MAIVFRSIAKVCLAAALSLILAPPFARAQLYTLSSITGWWDYDGHFIRQVDPATGATISVKGITLPPGTYGMYTTGLAAHPTTGEFFALVPSAPTPTDPICQHQLVKIHPTTGAATIIGDTGVCFASLAFHTNGTLYGVTDGVSPSLFTLNTTDASTTFLISFGATGVTSGAVVGGPALAFNPNDGLLYRSARLPPSGQIFQSISPNTLAVTDIPLSGSPTYEITALTHASGNTFLGADTGNQLFSITSSGVRTLIGSLDHLARGLAFAIMPGSVPSAALVDFDGDGKSDIAVFRNGTWLIQDAVSGALKKAVWTGGVAGDIPTPGDYDGDGVTDLSLYRNGAWLFFNNTTGAFTGGVWTGGVAGDISVPGDYDGDGKTDVAIYRGGAWLVWDATTGVLKKAVWTGGLPGDIPTPGDYDGDGVTDLSLYRNGAWLFFNNTTGAFTGGVWTGGVTGDISVPGDYDGDGKTDVAIYRGGAWLVWDATTGVLKKAVWTGALPGEIPTPGDYDGDGVTDLSSYRNGGWLFFDNTSGAFLGGIWTGGVAGDIPVSSKVPVR